MSATVNAFPYRPPCAAHKATRAAGIAVPVTVLADVRAYARALRKAEAIRRANDLARRRAGIFSDGDAA